MFRTDDGSVYVVKFVNNKVGPRALANEFVAASLGEELGLPFPESAVIYIDEKLLAASRWLNQLVTPGPHFGCRYLGQTSYVNRSLLGKAVNRNELVGVMLFDHWLQNFDRTVNRKNLLIRREAEGYRVYAIDHSHLFRKARWTVDWLHRIGGDLTVNTRRTYGLLLKYYVTPEDFSAAIEKISALSNDDLVRTVAAIPKDWLPEEAEREVLAAHLIRRRDLVGKIAQALFSYIPKRE